jgi:hypothetical protein
MFEDFVVLFCFLFKILFPINERKECKPRTILVQRFLKLSLKYNKNICIISNVVGTKVTITLTVQNKRHIIILKKA